MGEVLLVAAGWDLLERLPRLMQYLAQAGDAAGRLAPLAAEEQPAGRRQPTARSVEATGLPLIGSPAEFTMNLGDSGVVVITGPNGSGKSTLLAQLAGRIPTPAGTLLPDGTPVHELPAQAVAETVTLVEAGDWLADDTVAANLRQAAPTADAASLRAALDWRVVFAVTAAGAAAFLVLLRRVQLPVGREAHHDVRSAFTAWPLWTYGLGLLEGAILLGILTYIVPALERDGLSTELAGALGATYGLGIIGGAYLAKQAVARVGRTTMIGIGSTTLLVAFLLASLSQGVAALTVTAVLIGMSNAFLHSSLQGWATDVAPAARATTVSVFVCSVFLGSSAATGLTAGLTRHGYGSVFAATCVATVVLAVLAVGSHALWFRRRTG